MNATALAAGASLLLGISTRTDYGYYAAHVVDVFPTVGDARI